MVNHRVVLKDRLAAGFLRSIAVDDVFDDRGHIQAPSERDSRQQLLGPTNITEGVPSEIGKHFVRYRPRSICRLPLTIEGKRVALIDDRLPNATHSPGIERRQLVDQLEPSARAGQQVVNGFQRNRPRIQTTIG